MYRLAVRVVVPAMVWLIGSYAIIFGAVMVVQALRLRGTPERLEGRRA
jgi:hypothetical protein